MVYGRQKCPSDNRPQHTLVHLLLWAVYNSHFTRHMLPSTNLTAGESLLFYLHSRAYLHRLQVCVGSELPEVLEARPDWEIEVACQWKQRGHA